MLPVDEAAKTRFLRYVRPRIQAFAISSRAPCRSVSFRCALQRSGHALPLEILYDKAQVCNRPCQDPRLKEDQRVSAN